MDNLREQIIGEIGPTNIHLPNRAKIVALGKEAIPILIEVFLNPATPHGEINQATVADCLIEFSKQGSKEAEAFIRKVALGQIRLTAGWGSTAREIVKQHFAWIGVDPSLDAPQQGPETKRQNSHSETTVPDYRTRVTLPKDHIVNEKDGSILVRIPAGDFDMGDGRDSGCPKHRVDLSEYWIGIYCVTNRQYGRFVSETRHRAPDIADFGQAIWKNGQCPADKLDHPVICVSWDDCAAYANWAGLSLPSEAQWEKAARGPKGLIYPWGNHWGRVSGPNMCRDNQNKGNDTTAPVWAYPDGVSGYGTLQQSGNVWEWCADWYESDYYGKSPKKDPAGPQGGSLRVIRGGSWFNGDASFFRGANRYWFDPANRRSYQGFRLVRNSR